MKPSSVEQRAKFKGIALGIAVRLVGVGFIFLGDGHSSLWSKALVVCGVILSVAGIGVLRYLLLAPAFSKIGTRIKNSRL